jgi:hypothetical protein
MGATPRVHDQEYEFRTAHGCLTSPHTPAIGTVIRCLVGSPGPRALS